MLGSCDPIQSWMKGARGRVLREQTLGEGDPWKGSPLCRGAARCDRERGKRREKRAIICAFYLSVKR